MRKKVPTYSNSAVEEVFVIKIYGGYTYAKFGNVNNYFWLFATQSFTNFIHSLVKTRLPTNNTHMNQGQESTHRHSGKN